MKTSENAARREARPDRHPLTNPGSPDTFDQGLLDEWFPATRSTPEGTFEIALVLAGAVSAGAYTAGVLDFLVEALDAWYERKAADPDSVPKHDVVVRAITGASAGGMNGAILAAACGYRFPHVTTDTPLWEAAKNPFYRPWVQQIDISALLGTEDIKSRRMESLLDCTVLQRIADDVVSYTGPSVDSAVRLWLKDPFQLTLTLTNLRGVPFKVEFSGAPNKSHSMVLHADSLSFAAPVSHAAPSGAYPPHVVTLPLSRSPHDPRWESLAQAAQATGAFPLALRPIRLLRHKDDYAWRFVYPTPGSGTAQVRWSKPDWPGGGPSEYPFHAVDGGTMNNEPFDIAHQALAGQTGRNPRDARSANRAVVMIDPFTDRPVCDEPARESLVTLACSLIGALKQQARFKPADLVLAQSETVFSRFIIAPLREHGGSECAVVSGGLGAFLGFFAEEYRRHDFLLGRANCQKFLREFFVLPPDNPLFAADRDAHEAGGLRDFASKERPGSFQITPLVGTASVPQPEPSWPAGVPGVYLRHRKRIARRVGKVFHALRRQLTKGHPFWHVWTYALSWGGAVLWWVWLRWKVLSAIRKEVNEAIAEVDGLPSDPGAVRWARCSEGAVDAAAKRER